MIRYILLVVLTNLFILIGVVAQKPQEVLGIAKENFDVSYYKEQSKLWLLEIEKDPKNAFAWYQRYKAQRAYLQLSDSNDWNKVKRDLFDKLRPIVDGAKEAIPESFEYQLLEAVNSSDKLKNKYLLRAFAIDPNRHETYESLLIHYVLKMDDLGARNISKKIIENNYYSNANLNWNHNSLLTAENNGVFISNGDMDALPRWALQYGLGIRRDVTVLSKYLLSFHADYRQKVFEQLGISNFKSKVKPSKIDEHSDEIAAHLIQSLQQPTYMSCGTNVNFFRKYGFEKNMYLVGITFRYSKKGFNNLQQTKILFDQVYKLEYLSDNFQRHREDDMVKEQMNVTYIPGIMRVLKHYEKIKDNKKVEHYKELLSQIAMDSGREQEIMSWY